MLRHHHVSTITALAALCACSVEPPSAPQVMALPSANKNFAQFQQEDATCRRRASEVIGIPAPSPGTPAPAPVPVDVGAEMQEAYDVAYTQCMYASGNQVTAPPATRAYLGPPYYGGYAPGYAFGPYYEFGFGYGGGRGYYRDGYRGGFHEGGSHEWGHGGGFRH